MKRDVPPTTVDYRLKVTPFLDDRDQQHKTRFTLETTQAFASFVYELTVKESIQANSIHLKVQGLKPPRLTIPASGHAKFEREYANLRGKYDVTLESIDGRTNTFTLQISQDTVRLVRSPREPFTELVLT